MSKKISFLIKFTLGFLVILSLAYADSLLIFPKKKPQLSKEVMEKRVSKNIIKPKSKPKGKIEITLKKEDLKPLKKPKDQEKVVEKIIEKKLGLILPKSKPLIVKKEIKKKQQKSKYYKQKDFNYAKKAIQLFEKGDWKGALNISKKAKDKSFYKFVQWKHLLRTPNAASFYDYQQFINNNSEDNNNSDNCWLEIDPPELPDKLRNIKPKSIRTIIASNRNNNGDGVSNSNISKKRSLEDNAASATTNNNDTKLNQQQSSTSIIKSLFLTFSTVITSGLNITLRSN